MRAHGRSVSAAHIAGHCDRACRLSLSVWRRVTGAAAPRSLQRSLTGEHRATHSRPVAQSPSHRRSLSEIRRRSPSPWQRRPAAGAPAQPTRLPPESDPPQQVADLRLQRPVLDVQIDHRYRSVRRAGHGGHIPNHAQRQERFRTDQLNRRRLSHRAHFRQQRLGGHRVLHRPPARHRSGCPERERQSEFRAMLPRPPRRQDRLNRGRRNAWARSYASDDPGAPPSCVARVF